MGAVAEGNEQPPVGRVFAGVAITRERGWQFARLRPRPALVLGKNYKRVFAPTVLAQEHTQLFAIGRTNDARLAQVHVRTRKDAFRLRPRQPAILGKCLVQVEHYRIGPLAGLGEKAPVVVEHRQIMPIAGFQFLEAAHHHDAAPVAGWFQLAPFRAVILAHRQARRIQPAPHDEPLLPLRIHHTMQRRHLAARRPTRRRGQPLAPRLAAISAAFVNNAAPPVAFRVNDQHRLAVLQQHRGRMPEVLSLLAIHHHLPVFLAG